MYLGANDVAPALPLKSVASYGELLEIIHELQDITRLYIALDKRMRLYCSNCSSFHSNNILRHLYPDQHVFSYSVAPI